VKRFRFPGQPRHSALPTWGAEAERLLFQAPNLGRPGSEPAAAYRLLLTIACQPPPPAPFAGALNCWLWEPEWRTGYSPEFIWARRLADSQPDCSGLITRPQRRSCGLQATRAWWRPVIG